MNWTAVTETGATYRETERGIFVNDDLYRSPGFKVVDRAVMSEQEDPWGYLRGLDYADDVPEVGKSIYVADSKAWRISTKVVSVQLN